MLAVTRACKVKLPPAVIWEAETVNVVLVCTLAAVTATWTSCEMEPLKVSSPG